MITRRQALRASIALATSTGLGAAILTSDGRHPERGFVGLVDRVNQRLQRALFRPNHLAPELPESELTRAGEFPAYFVSDGIPLAPPGWALEVSGMVARPRSFSLDDLQRMPRTHTRVRHHCVEGWSAVADFHGVRVRDLAEIVGVDPRATIVELRSFDGDYWSTWDRESAMHPQTILAYGRNGAPIEPAYGAPLRLHSAVKLGYKMVKYLTSIRFMQEPADLLVRGYWESRGYEWFAGV